MSNQNPIYVFQLRALNKDFTQHCITQCVDFQSKGKLVGKEETCLKNCSNKVAQYKKYAKDLGYPFIIMKDEEIADGGMGSEQEQSLATKHNMQLVKDYLKNARFTMIALGVIWVMFVIECLYSWIVVTTAGGVVTIPSYTLIKMGANNCLMVKVGQVYRLFTATILHAGLLHIFFNTASLLAFCAEMEAVITFKLYVAVFVIGGIQGNMLSDLYNFYLGNSSTIGVGASTSICAIMGLYIAKLYIESRKNGTVELAKRKIITMLAYLLVISILPQVDFFGHFGSLVSGALLGLAVIPRGDAEVSSLSWLGIAGFGVYSLFLMAIFA